MRTHTILWLARLILLLVTVCLPRAAAAASLQEVQGFGNNPSNARMFLYVPDRVATTPGVLVAIHYCGGNAMQYFTGTGYRALADQYGFIVIYPQTTSSDGCFDVHSSATLKHDGGSDSAAIVSMARYVIMKHAADANRVYVAGTSSGAMMTNVLLGAYPDVFRAGASFAGVPFACFAGQGAWNSACSSGQTTKSGQEWGDLVRAAYPGYTGPRPSVQLWHGDRDETLNFHNFGEAIKQWTNVLGVSEQATSSEQDVPQRGWTRTRYADSAGVVRVEAVLEAGMTHNLTVPAAEVIRFFGLDGKADPGGTSAGDAGVMVTADGGADAAAPDAGTGASARDAGVDAGRAQSDAGTRTDASATMSPVAGDAAADAGSAPSGLPVANADAGPIAVDGQDGERADDDGGCSAARGRTRTGDVTWLLTLTVLGVLALRRRRVPHFSDVLTSSTRSSTLVHPPSADRWAVYERAE